MADSQFRLTEVVEDFAAGVPAIKEAITDAHPRGLCELDIYSDSRSELRPLKNLVPWDRAIAEIKESNSENSGVTYEIFPLIRARRLKGDFYVNQVLTEHGAFSNHRARLFRKNATCFCGDDESRIRHCLFVCALWRFTWESFSRGTTRLEHSAIYVQMSAAGRLLFTISSCAHCITILPSEEMAGVSELVAVHDMVHGVVERNSNSPRLPRCRG